MLKFNSVYVLKKISDVFELIRSEEVESKCYNYKFFLLLLFPLAGVMISTILLISTSISFFLSFGMCLISSVLFIELVFLEPVYYTINAKGVEVVCVFKRYYFAWKQIKSVELRFDVFFEFLFVKDYIIISDTSSGTVKRYERIMKYTKTNKLMELYGKSKISR